MAYRFKLDEEPGKAFRRITREQIAIVQRELGTETISPPAIHASRKAIKRLRALVRCAAPALGPSAAKSHDKTLRDIARLVSSRRDSDVVIEAVTKLEVHFGDEAKAVLRPLRQLLEAGRAVRSEALNAEAIFEVRKRLIDEGRRLEKARWSGRGMAKVLQGIEHNYRRGRRALKAAYAAPTDNSVHELRKAVQVHWRQMALLSRAWPAEFAARVEAAREVSQLLGDDHDLSLLKLLAANLPDADRRGVHQLCVQRQMQLRDEAHSYAVRIHAEKPAEFAIRLSLYLRAALKIRTAKSGASSPVNSDETAPPADTAASGSPQLLAAKKPAKGRSQQQG